MSDWAMVTYESGDRETVKIGTLFFGRSLLRVEIQVRAVTYIDQKFQKWVQVDILTRLTDVGELRIGVSP